MKQLSFLGFILCLALSSAAQKKDYPITPVPFTSVKLTDKFWLPRIQTNHTVTIPASFKRCETTGRVKNFEMAAARSGKFCTVYPFDDTDVYKTIEGASFSLSLIPDKKLELYIDSLIDIIGRAQEPDGYLYTARTINPLNVHPWLGKERWEKEREHSHELYNAGHLYEAAAAHYLATGKKNLLTIALKNADLVCSVFGPDRRHVAPGHEVIEMGLVKLYRITGKTEYLNTAKFFIEERGNHKYDSLSKDPFKNGSYWQDHKPVVKQDEAIGHAVRAGYLYAAVADVAALTDDKDFLDAIDKIWSNVVQKKIYVQGGVGAVGDGERFGGNYELPNATAYNETCAAIANVYWNQRMFLATGDSKYIDVLERALYNGVISGVSLSGDKFFYDNPLESMGQHERQAWFGCACCPGNITRFMASVPGYMYAVQENTLFVNLYSQSISNIEIQKNKVEIKQTSEYPWDGKVILTVTPTKVKKFTLKLRMPGWAENSPVPTDLYAYAEKINENVQVLVNGKASKSTKEKGYISIKRLWKKGDRIEFQLPMPVRRVKANDNVVDDRGKMAFERGPVLYCLEAVDQTDKHVFNKFIPENAPINYEFKNDLLNGVLVLKGTAQQIEKEGDAVVQKEVPFTAIPYSTWNNRGANEMAVWMPVKAEIARPTPDSTIASSAIANVYGVNDQWEPTSSSDVSKPYHYWWLKKGTEESLDYVFDKIETVSNVQIYWLNFDHYDGNFRVPESWKLLYKDGEDWKEVETNDEYTTNLNSYNSLNFKPVETYELKIVVKLQDGLSGGVLEWKVK